MQLAETDWWAAANEIMFTIMGESAEFTREDFYRYGRRVRFTPHFMEEAWSRLLLEFSDAGYIRKTDKTISSGGSTGRLRVWEKVTEE